jgi:hypothetical protein
LMSSSVSPSRSERRSESSSHTDHLPPRGGRRDQPGLRCSRSGRAGNSA